MWLNAQWLIHESLTEGWVCINKRGGTESSGNWLTLSKTQLLSKTTWTTPLAMRIRDPTDNVWDHCQPLDLRHNGWLSSVTDKGLQNWSTRCSYTTRCMLLKKWTDRIRFLMKEACRRRPVAVFYKDSDKFPLSPLGVQFNAQ